MRDNSSLRFRSGGSDYDRAKTCNTWTVLDINDLLAKT